MWTWGRTRHTEPGPVRVGAGMQTDTPGDALWLCKPEETGLLTKGLCLQRTGTECLTRDTFARKQWRNVSEAPREGSGPSGAQWGSFQGQRRQCGKSAGTGEPGPQQPFPEGFTKEPASNNHKVTREAWAPALGTGWDRGPG